MEGQLPRAIPCLCICVLLVRSNVCYVGLLNSMASREKRLVLEEVSINSIHTGQGNPFYGWQDVDISWALCIISKLSSEIAAVILFLSSVRCYYNFLWRNYLLVNYFLQYRELNPETYLCWQVLMVQLASREFCQLYFVQNAFILPSVLKDLCTGHSTLD